MLYGISYEGAAGPFCAVLAPALDSAQLHFFPRVCIVHDVLIVRANADCRGVGPTPT